MEKKTYIKSQPKTSFKEIDLEVLRSIMYHCKPTPNRIFGRISNQAK